MHEAWYDAAMTMEREPAPGEDSRGRNWQQEQELAIAATLTADAVADAAAMTHGLATEMDQRDTQQWQRLKLASETVTQLAVAAEAVRRLAHPEQTP